MHRQPPQGDEPQRRLAGRELLGRKPGGRDDIERLDLRQLPDLRTGQQGSLRDVVEDEQGRPLDADAPLELDEDLPTGDRCVDPTGIAHGIPEGRTRLGQLTHDGQQRGLPLGPHPPRPRRIAAP